MCHAIRIAISFILRGNLFLFQYSTSQSSSFAMPEISTHHQQMSSSKSLWRPITVTKVPGLTPVLIGAPSDLAECDFCGNAFEDDQATVINLPCFDAQCRPCARLWHVLTSPSCMTCYGDFICPRLANNQADKFSPRLFVKANHTIQLQSPWKWQIESPPNPQTGYVEVRGAYAKSSDESFLHPKVPLGEEEHDLPAASELSDENLLEALALFNERFDTNFSIRDIEEEIPLADLRKCTQPQLESKLTRFYSESVDDDAEDGSSQLPDGDDLDDEMIQQDEEMDKVASHPCIHCQRSFRTAGHLRKHMVAHMPAHLTCSICGKVLKNTSSRRQHEKKHRETDSEREERLRKAQAGRDQARAGGKGVKQKVLKQKRRGRVPQA